MLAENYAVCFGVPGLVVRLFSAFGEDQRRLLVWELFRQHREAAEVVLAGTGEEERDYLHVDDLAALVWRCAQSVPEPFASLNIASGVSIRVGELAQRIGVVLGRRRPVVCQGQRNPGDPAIWRADVARMRELAGADAAPGLDARLRQVLAAWSR
jgi:UDP-glucose 4-epimerase